MSKPTTRWGILAVPETHRLGIYGYHGGNQLSHQNFIDYMNRTNGETKMPKNLKEFERRKKS